MNKIILNFLIISAAIIGFFALCFAIMDASAKSQAEYAAAHNCRYESGFCYTYEQRGYLFPEQCRADKACRDNWGL